MIGLGTRADAEDGFVGGLEALAFGLLVFVVGTLLVVNAWRIVDARFAANAAAREAVRAAVESPADADLVAVASDAAAQAFVAHGYPPERGSLATETPLVIARCAPIAITATLRVDAVAVPLIGGRGGTSVAATYEELVDPYRGGLPATDGAPCDL